MRPFVRVSGLRQFTLELDKATSRMLPEVTAVVGKGALNVKKDWQKRWRSDAFKHLRLIPYTIGYDVVTLPGRVLAEIGPDIQRKQGSLAFIAELGSPTSAPHPGGVPAWEAELPRFEAAMAALTVKLFP